MQNLLEKLVSINSIFPHEKNLAELLAKELIKNKFKVERNYLNENRFNLLSEKGEGKKSYLLYAHMDTVPVYSKWSSDPFKLRIEGDKAIGLGTTDMKGGIVAILKAIKDFEPRNYKLKIAFGVDEENYSAGAYQITKTNYLSDVKGILVPESSLPAHQSDKAGSTISIGRKGRTVFLLKIYGKSAHGVNPHWGINAINEGSKLINYLQNFPLHKHKEMGSNSFFVRRFESKTNSLSIPDYAEIEIDFHLVPPDNSQKLKNELKLFINKLYSDKKLNRGEQEFELIFAERPTSFLEPFILDSKTKLIKISSEAVQEIYGEYSYNYGQSVADENVFGSLGIPTLTLGPLGDNHHTADEWVSLKSLEKLADIYRLILKKLDSV